MKQRKKSFNLRFYDHAINEWLGEISEDDRRFVANRAASIYRSVDDGCVDNLRMSKVIDGAAINPEYHKALDKGCCGFIDRVVTNPLTGNSFVIGFNFGH